jgi:hypothetical protein
MIKNFKVFEKNGMLPKVGDYVVFDLKRFPDINDIWVDLMKNNIGFIAEIEKRPVPAARFYTVRFDVEDEALKDLLYNNTDIYGLEDEDFEYWSPNLDEVELYLNSKKYNL